MLIGEGYSRSSDVHREIAGGHSSAIVVFGSPESCWSVGLGK
jgi:hypothetical protein